MRIIVKLNMVMFSIYEMLAKINFKRTIIQSINKIFFFKARRPFSPIWINIWCYNIVFSIGNLLSKERACLGGFDCEGVYPIDIYIAKIKELLHSIVHASS
jgi:hypothetical protein